MSNNQEIAKIFNEIAQFLRIDEVPFRPQAYERAAFSLESLDKDVKEIYIAGGIKALMEISGIGKNLAEHIEEYLKTKKIKVAEELKKKLPVKIDELSRVEGLGSKKINVLYKELGIKNLKNLETAAKKGKIAYLEGFGKKTEKNILEGLEFLKKSKGRLSIGEIMPIAKEVLEKLSELKEVEKISFAGSLRRKKETIGDVDILVVSKKPKKVMDFFVGMPMVEKVWGKGDTKSSIHVSLGFDIDLRVVKKDSWGSALQYFTGSKEHNVAVRKVAIEKGLKLNEYGLFKGKKLVASKEEQDIYKKLGMDLPPPEIREDDGKIASALKNELPSLVELKDIKGDLHCHSDWNGGKDSILKMCQKAMSLGYEYIGISDHTKFLKIENGLDEKKLLAQKKEIEKINKDFKKKGLKFRVLHGAETNILQDGSIDIKDSVLAELDYVIAGVHSSLKMPKKEMMKRIEKAMRNPNVDIISHPTGRLLGKRDEYQHDFDKMLDIAKETKTILEINASPHRLDLRDLYIRRAKIKGVKMIINTDSHQAEQMDLMEYGIWQAKRGWAEPENIINTFNLEKILKNFK